MANTPVTYVALLRGINVGGNTLISMTELKACFEELGYTDVKTYINSGNVIFRTAKHDVRSLEVAIEQSIAKRFSYNIYTIVVSMDTLDRLIGQAPKSWLTAKDMKCNVIFLRHTIDTPDILSNFNPKPDIEELHYHPGVLFWAAQTSSLTKSNMLKVSSMPIYKDMTVRIFNTVRKIHAIMQETDARG